MIFLFPVSRPHTHFSFSFYYCGCPCLFFVVSIPGITNINSFPHSTPPCTCIKVLSPGKALVQLMLTNSSIVSLRASYCNVGMNTIHDLSSVLAEHNRTLTALDVSANSLWWDEINVDELDSDRCFGKLGVCQVFALKRVVRTLRVVRHVD